MKSRLVIGSRGSKLALWQAESIKAQLAGLHPQVELSIEIIKTTGDTQLDQPLAVIGGKGVFTKEIEEALIRRRIDLAVHSLKDLPTSLPDGLTLAAITERDDPRDALVLRGTTNFSLSDINSDDPLAGLGTRAVVGTSSLRRLAQLKHHRPDLKIKEIRGNVDTRLRKLDAGDYDAVILAAAGLCRLGLQRRISVYLSPAVMLPAVGQGALAIETRGDDSATLRMLGPLDHPPTRSACQAERALLRSLGGGCQLPIAAHAIVRNGDLKLDALVSDQKGQQFLRDSIAGAVANAEKLGETLARKLLERGAGELLERK